MKYQVRLIGLESHLICPENGTCTSKMEDLSLANFTCFSLKVSVRVSSENSQHELDTPASFHLQVCVHVTSYKSSYFFQLALFALVDKNKDNEEI